MVSYNKAVLLIAVLLAAIGSSSAGPAAYAVCQTGCNVLVVACYAAAGLTFGTVTAGVGAPAAALACNAGLGVCMSSCAAALLAPTP